MGGIEIFYETKSGKTTRDGIIDLPCRIAEASPQSLVLNEIEYITAISGSGTDFIKSLVIETNFYRKIKMGQKAKGEVASPKSSLSGQGSFSSGMGKMEFGRRGGFGTSGESFQISMPAGAKVTAIAGSADQYLRSIFTFYKI